MFLQIIDVLIGLVVVYLVFSTATSAAVELLEAIIRRRGRLLLDGVRELFRAAQLQPGEAGKSLDELVEIFYNSPHIASLFKGTLKRDKQSLKRAVAARFQVVGGSLPSYITPERFAAALVSLASSEGVARLAADEAAAVRAQFERIAEVARSLYQPPGAAPSTPAEQQLQIAQYFEDSTERFSGWYRRHVQFVLFFVGIALAGALNLDTLRIAQILSGDSKLRTQIVEQALQDIGSGKLTAEPLSCAPSADGAAMPDEACEAHLRHGIAERVDYASSLGLPIGWRGDPLIEARPAEAPWVFLGYLVQKILGCLMTALAICMGAPFWFDRLNKLANLRTTLKPLVKAAAEKRTQ